MVPLEIEWVFFYVALHGLLKVKKIKFEQNVFGSGFIIPPARHIFGFFTFGSGIFLI